MSDGWWRGLRVWCVLSVALAIFGLLYPLSAPDLGLTERLEAGRRIVAAVDPGGAAEHAGLLPGDEIVRDPIPFGKGESAQVRWRLAASRALRAHHVEVVAARAGVERVLVVEPQGPTLPSATRYLHVVGPRLPTLFAYLAVSVLLGLRPRRTERTQFFVSLSLALTGPCFALAAIGAQLPPALFGPAYVFVDLALPLGNAFATYAVLNFPTRISESSRTRTLIFTPAIAGGALSALLGLGALDLPLDAALPRVVYLHGSALASLVIVVIVQRRLARDPVARRQVAWMTYSLLPVLLIGVPARLFLPRDIGSPLASLVSVIPPVVVAAVVMRYRLFQFDALAPRASVYAIMVAGSMLLYVVLLATAGRLVGGLVGSRGEIVRLGALAVVVAIFEPLRSLARDGIDRLFSRDRPALQARCARVVTQLDGAFDDEEICAATQRGLDAWVTRLLDLPRELSAPERPSRELDRLGALRVVELDDPATVDGLLARRIDALVAVPVEPGSGGPWALALGFPASAHPWDRLERDALSSVGRAVGAALDQRAARRALATEIERAEEERQRIARELHDGLGATLTAASLTTQLARKAQDGAGPMEALDTLDRTLREGLADLRVALWSLDARFASWDDLYTRLRRHVSDLCAASGLSLEMSGRCEGAGKASPLLRLTAYRIVQEAVNNAVRHARAQRLRVDLQADPSGVEIVVEDDGVGLLPEAAGHAAPGRETGRGLSNMVRRVEDLHGTIRFSRPAGGGSAIHVKLPGATRAAGVSASSS